MLGSLDQNSKEVSIVGGGIAGLLAAYSLDKAGKTVHLFEKANRLGGMLNTIQTRHGIVETAAHSLLASEPVEKLAKELGVELLSVKENSKDRFIWRDGKMTTMPLSKIEMAGAGLKALATPNFRGSNPAMTFENFGRAHLGKKATDYLLAPFLIGIYGCQTHELSVAAVFPQLIPARFTPLATKALPKLLQKLSGSAPSNPMKSPRCGMADFTRALENLLREKLGDRLHMGTEVRSLSDLPSPNNVVLTLPPGQASALIESDSPELAARLRETSFAPLMSATIFVKAEDFETPPSGVGVLVPPKENRHCLGILFNSSSFEGRVDKPDQMVSLTMMLGGTLKPKYVDYEEDLLRPIIRDELKTILGFKGDLTGLVLNDWQKAIPVYNERLYQTWQLARQSCCKEPGRVLFGNYTGQVSIRSMIETAEKNFK